MQENQIFDGRYKILKVLGRGGSGTVYLAENINLGTYWAIKAIDKNPNSEIDVLVEPHILKKLEHPSLPRIFDYFEDDAHVYIVVDYIDGVSLDVELEKVGHFSEETVVYWTMQICEVLNYLHSQKPSPIIFRDLKPSNIMIDRKGHIKLIDFGIAREYKLESITDTISIGTRGYAAPEQYGGSQTTQRSDIFSLGVTLYHLLTGKSPSDPPFEMKMLRSVDNDFSEAIEYIVFKCGRGNPDERYQSVTEIMDDLHKYYRIEVANSANISVRDDKSAHLVKHDKYNTVSFKRQILSVLGNHEFAAELAYITAKVTDLKVLLVNLDFTNSTLDLSLNLIPDMERRLDNQDTTFGFKPLISMMNKNSLNYIDFTKMCFKKVGVENLFIFADIYSVENYENYADLNLEGFIDFCYRNFDITILAINHAIHDKYNRVPLKRADANMIAVPANLDVLREMETFMNYVNKKDGVPLESTRLIAFEYRKEVNLSENVLKKFFKAGSFVGTISYQPEREESRNIDSFYAKIVFKIQIQEYYALMQKFNIIPKKTFGDRISKWLSIVGKK